MPGSPLRAAWPSIWLASAAESPSVTCTSTQCPAAVMFWLLNARATVWMAGAMSSLTATFTSTGVVGAVRAGDHCLGSQGDHADGGDRDSNRHQLRRADATGPLTAARACCP